MPFRSLFAVPCAAALLSLSACNPAPDVEAPATETAASTIEVTQAWSRATAEGQEAGGGFLHIVNSGEGADRLVGGSSPAAAEVQIHTMSMDGGVMRMRELEDGLEVPAGGSVMLAPGGNHIMLMGLNAPLAEGSKVPLTLDFEKAGKIEVELEVRAAGAEQGGGHDHG